MNGDVLRLGVERPLLTLERDRTTVLAEVAPTVFLFSYYAGEGVHLTLEAMRALIAAARAGELDELVEP